MDKSVQAEETENKFENIEFSKSFYFAADEKPQTRFTDQKNMKNQIIETAIRGHVNPNRKNNI